MGSLTFGVDILRKASTEIAIGSTTNPWNIVSPDLTGTPTAPTAASGTNTTQVATTAFVKNAVDAIPFTTLYRQFWSSTQEISHTLAVDSKTYIIFCAASSSGTNGAIGDGTNGAFIVVSNGKYIVLHKGSGITISLASSVLTISCSTSIAMGIVEL